MDNLVATGFSLRKILKYFTNRKRTLKRAATVRLQNRFAAPPLCRGLSAFDICLREYL